MTRDKDLRMKLTDETHRVLGELARGSETTLQTYVERLIISHINGRLEEARRLVQAADGALKDSTSTRSQHLYFIQRGGSDGPIKIGVASSVSRRMKSLQTGSNEVLTLLHECEQVGDINERAVHRKYREQRLEGEWFKATPNLLAFIQSLGGHGK